MTIWEIFLISVGLAMDAFAVAVCKGLKMPKINKKQTALIALFFGGFQGLMPLIGYFLGKQFEEYIVSIDHWITFVLLGVIGGKMIYESFKKDEDDCDKPFSIKELFVLAIATSIDALAVGITFAFLKVKIAVAVSFIGVITAGLSAVGVFIGHKFGEKYKSKAEFAGGLILVLIGLKILLEHLGIINF